MSDQIITKDRFQEIEAAKKSFLERFVMECGHLIFGRPPTKLSEACKIILAALDEDGWEIGYVSYEITRNGLHVDFEDGIFRLDAQKLQLPKHERDLIVEKASAAKKRIDDKQYKKLVERLKKAAE